MINWKIEGSNLVITLPVSAAALAQAEPSKSGKTRVVASTHGFLTVTTPAGPMALSINLTTKNGG